VSDRPRSEGFRRLGAVRPTDLDLPPSKARMLLLQEAWTRLAGDAIVQRTGGVTARRGVLEVRCLDRTWKGALLALLPRLARAVAAECPELEVTSWRLTVEGESGASETAPILSLVDARPAAAGGPDERTPPRETREAETRSPGERIAALRDRYLEVRRPPRS
jgi:hypothetical protein